MMTEDDAREKWCPLIRIHEEPSMGTEGSTYAYNRPEAMGGMTCIASDCMAWEWGEEEYELTHSGGEVHHVLPLKLKTDRKGDCGLKRGKP